MARVGVTIMESNIRGVTKWDVHLASYTWNGKVLLIHADAISTPVLRTYTCSWLCNTSTKHLPLFTRVTDEEIGMFLYRGHVDKETIRALKPSNP